MPHLSRVLCLLLPLLALDAHGVPDGLHPTPMMGFSSWNTFYEDNDEVKMMGIADALVDLGLDSYGYVYVTVDDYWNTPDRDSDGNMKTNLTRFPNGMKALGDHLHSLGLKYGIYSDAGDKTCAGMAGSLGYEQQDLDLFLSFGIDYLKYDNCYPTPEGNNPPGTTNNVDYNRSYHHMPSIYQKPSEEDRFRVMGDALAAVKDVRNITFELCLYGWGNVELWGPEIGHLWRTTTDAFDAWQSVLRNIDRNDEARFLEAGNYGPEVGGWNYPDALFVGKGGMTNDEYRTQFALWCAVKSPLMIGTDLRDMTVQDEAYKILTNTELLAINQDPLGIQATCVKDCCGRHPFLGGMIPNLVCDYFHNSWQVWTGPLEGDAHVVVVVNRFNEAVDITMDWGVDAALPAGNYQLRDLWSHEDLGVVTVGSDVYNGTLQQHANWAFKLTLEESISPIPDVAPATSVNSLLLAYCCAVVLLRVCFE